MKRSLSLVAAAVLIGALSGCNSDEASRISGIEKIGSYDAGGESSSEISAFDGVTKRVFTTNSETKKIDVLDASDPTNLIYVTSLDMGFGVQSVSVKNGKLAIAVGSDNKVTTKGKVVIYDISDINNYTKLSETRVGYLPDMVTFNEDGTKVVVANEGEPIGTAIGTYATDPNKKVTTVTTVGTAGDYVDVKGSIGIITVANATVTENTDGYVEVTFDSATLSDAADGTPVRLGGTPSDEKAYDIEPEYITVSGNYAYVTLQENNAMAKVNLTTNSLEFVKSYGAKSYEEGSGNTIDIEEEGDILMKNYKGLFGLYMPDSIASYTHNGATYLVTANEGDGREYPISDVTDGPEKGEVLLDEEKIKNLNLDASLYGVYDDEDDLKVVTDMGDIDNDGKHERLYTYGGRSFSIWNADGDLVYDSGDIISKKVAEIEPMLFNIDENEIDGRSGNKGSEPEGLALGTIDGRTYAFVGLERQSAILIFEITNPTSPEYINYISTKDPQDPTAGDISPEGMLFIPAAESPNGKNLLLVSNEVSGSTALYEIK